MTKRKFSTSTLSLDGIVPWLAASGPLAYTPENPPAEDYYFHYEWILPGIFADRADTKRHRFFGWMFKEDARNAYQFWQNSREGKANRVCLELGSWTEKIIKAPIAVYRHDLFGRDEPGLMFIQHGSYQHIRLEDQPEIENGLVYLYRGIGKATEFKWLRFDPATVTGIEKEAWHAFVKTQASAMSDSVISFNSIHDRAVRSETELIKDRSRMSNDVARAHGLNIDSDGFPGLLWECHHNCFGMESWVAERKFGPNYVICKTPVNNIRITTWFAGETEAKIVDPSKVEFIKGVGCAIDAAPFEN